MSTNYSSLLSDLIDKSGLSLTEIAEITEKHGQKITTSYLSKLKNGKMPPPSYKMSAALAICLGIDPEVLLSAGIKDNAEANQEELKKTFMELNPNKTEEEIEYIVKSIVPPPSSVIIYTPEELAVMNERELTPDALKNKYNLVIEGKPATDEEIEEMIKYIKFLRVQKEMESS